MVTRELLKKNIDSACEYLKNEQEVRIPLRVMGTYILLNKPIDKEYLDQLEFLHNNTENAQARIHINYAYLNAKQIMEQANVSEDEPHKSCKNCVFREFAGWHSIEANHTTKFELVDMCSLYNVRTDKDKVCDSFDYQELPPNYRNAN